MAIPKIQTNIRAEQALAPFNHFDSLLEFPKRTSMLYKQQNAWLTLKMRIRLNFVDQNDLGWRLVYEKGERHYTDFNGDLFPIRNWTTKHKDKFRKLFKTTAEKTWNYHFVLQTPLRYAGLDHTVSTWNGPVANWRVRPNVICLFRLELVEKNQHYTIDVANLDIKSAKETYEYNKKHGTDIPIEWYDGSFRSDDRTLVFQDSPRTIGHEIGHGLGQDHIMPLLGKTCGSWWKIGNNSPDCYGKSPMERGNIMGAGKRIYLTNAISWQKRMAMHCPGTSPTSWQATGIMKTPPRKTSEKLFAKRKLF